MVERIFQVEREEDGDIVFRFKPPLRMALPDATKQHLLSAQREVLLAMRSALEGAIEQTEEVQRSKVKKEKTKIKVQ